MLKLKNSPNIATGRVELKQKTKNEHLFIKSLNDNIKITKTRDFYPLFRYLSMPLTWYVTTALNPSSLSSHSTSDFVF